MTKLTRKQFAAELGVTHQRVTAMVKQGLPLNADGTLSAKAARKWYAENVNPSRRKSNRDDTGNASRRELEKLKVERERLALKKDSGEVIDRAEIRKALFERARGERDSWIAWSSRMASELAAEIGCDPGELFATLDREVRAHLDQLSKKKTRGLTHD